MIPIFPTGIIATPSSPIAEDVSLERAETAKAARSAILSYLRTHRAWYEDWAKFYAFAWNLLTFLVLVLGALTSILTAIGGIEKVVLIALPAISSLCAAALIQFRLRDACRIRDHGRIATELLICKALALPMDDPRTTKEAAIRLREAAHQLELEQLAQFMVESSQAKPQDDKPLPSRGPESGD